MTSKTSSSADVPFYLCCVRPFQPPDGFMVRELVSSATMCTVRPFFTAAFFREVLWEALVAILALLFVLLHVPGNVCLMLVPGFFAAVYSGIWLAHRMKALAVQSGDMANVPDTYQNAAGGRSGFWVAEMYEPLTGPAGRFQLTFVSPADLERYSGDLRALRRRVVGSCGLRRNREDTEGGWLTRMCVQVEYQSHGVGARLLEAACDHALSSGYASVQTQTTECHDAAKSLLYKNGFQILQYIHKPVFIGVKVGVYKFSKKLKASKKTEAKV